MTSNKETSPAATSANKEITSEPILMSDRAAMINQVVCVTHGRPTTTSIVISEKFGKRHTDILRSIAKLDCSGEFRQRNFASANYLDEQQKPRPMFEITRDGFAFLAMGFTGKKAAEWKERFIAAFNKQTDDLNRHHLMHTSPNWQKARFEGKSAREGETDVIKTFIEYAKIQGSTGADNYYQILTTAVNRSLFFVGGAVGKDFRSSLCAEQLDSLAMAERIVKRALLEAMASNMYYKDAYRFAVNQLRQLAALIGQSSPGQLVTLLQKAA